MAQESIFDVIQARDNRDQAVGTVGGERDDTWKAEACAVIETFCQLGGTWTADDVWQSLADREVSMPTEPRSLGQVIMSYRRAGKIEPVGYQQCKRPSRNGGAVRVWRAR